MKKLLTVLSVLMATVITYCGPSKQTIELMNQAKDIFGAIPVEMPGSSNESAEKIALGKKLYFEKSLSSDNTVSCNSCHNVEGKGSGTDNAPTSTGIKGQKGGRNAPTVLNAGFHIAQFWDGRAADLKAQAKGPILNPIEMGMKNPKEVMEKLKSIPEYSELFSKAFPDQKDPLTYDNLADAIAAFERTLVTHDRFDDFMNGNAKALSPDEQTGLKTFIDTGCNGCHNGPLLGGNSYQKLGAVNDYNTSDIGRFAVTKKEEDKKVFKVPSLRNIAITGPYFHDGSVSTLEDAVKKMAYHQLGKEISEQDISQITTFLKTLTDKTK